MSDEAQIRSSLQINIGELVYQSQPTAFTADVSVANGPTPGVVLISTSGTNIDFSQLTTPGLCRIMNLDSTNFVEYGIWDPELSRFYPLGELLPGETYPLRLSRNLQSEYGTGTGTSGPDTNRLRFRADTADCRVLVEAFEK